MTTTTTTLAESLLDDLDDLMESDDDAGDSGEKNSRNIDDGNGGVKSGGDDAGDDDGDDDDENSEEKRNTSTTSSTVNGSKSTTDSGGGGFLETPSLQRHLDTIRKQTTTTVKTTGNGNDNSKTGSSSKESEEQNHQLVVQSNKFLSQLSDELLMAHQQLATKYSPKFSELETLVPNTVQYKNAVKIIGNEMDLSACQDELSKILTNSQIMTISVAGSTTSGRPLTDGELRSVQSSVDYIERLLSTQEELQSFVEQSMEELVPSTSTLIGPSMAAKLLGLTGGLAELTKIPSCNLQTIGQTKITSDARAGMSGLAVKRNAGLLTNCDLVLSVPKAFQKKALKVVSAKLALAIRYDFVNVNTGRPRSAECGQKLKAELIVKFEKWQEPDMAPTAKALPKPDLEVKKRRGGKRMRKWKERFEETALMKQANTRAFGSQQGAEYGDDSMGLTMGLLDTADKGGSVRKVAGEKRKKVQTNTKASRKRAAQMANSLQNKDGLASSVVFGQTTGNMELINPEIQKERVRQANNKWFSDNAGFQSVNKSSTKK